MVNTGEQTLREELLFLSEVCLASVHRLLGAGVFLIARVAGNVAFATLMHSDHGTDSFGARLDRPVPLLPICVLFARIDLQS